MLVGAKPIRQTCKNKFGHKTIPSLPHNILHWNFVPADLYVGSYSIYLFHLSLKNVF